MFSAGSEAIQECDLIARGEQRGGVEDRQQWTRSIIKSYFIAKITKIL